MGTKNKILEAAYQLFHEESYDKVSIEDICSKCRLTKPAFYYHFSSKADLLLHYYDDVINYLHETLKTKEFNDQYWEQFIFCFTELIKASESLGADLMKQLYIANLNEDKGSFDFNRSFSEIGIRLIEQAQQEGQIRNQQDATELFIATSFVFTGFEVFWSIKKGKIERHQNMVRALETIVDIVPEFSVADKDFQLCLESFEREVHE